MLPYPDPLSPASKELATPQAEAPVLPPPEREKKPAKKLETPVLVAIISAVVTLMTSLMGSPLLLNLLNKTDAPAPTPTAQIAISQNSLLPNNPSGGSLFQVPFTPTASGVNIIQIPSMPPGETPTSAPALLEPAFTATALPPEPPPTAAAPSYFQCLAADLWFPYPSSLNPEISNGCWSLAEWGFSINQNRLYLAHNPGQDQERGISMPISGDVDIRFSVRLDQFRTHSNKVGFLNFGIVQNDPFSIYTGGYLSYQQPAPGPASPVRVLISGSRQATQKISDLEAGFLHEVLFSIQDDLLTVYLNGDQAGDPVRLPAGERAFWIGYVLPSKGELEGMVSGLDIQAR